MKKIIGMIILAQLAAFVLALNIVALTGIPEPRPERSPWFSLFVTAFFVVYFTASYISAIAALRR